MSDDLSRMRTLSPEEKRALLRSLRKQEPVGSRTAPLSFAQQRLWFLEQLEDMGSTYHMPLRRAFQGPLDADALRRALDRIVARHEVLRTTFGQVDGKPVQRVSPAQANGFALVQHDLRGAPDPEAALRDLVDTEAKTRFDLTAGPLIRGHLARVADDEHVLLVNMHHIVSDGWSMGVFARELTTLYDAFRNGAADDPLSPLPTQYADYATWQRRWVEGEILERQAGYWERTLAGAPELLELPADHPRPLKQDFAGASVPVELDAELSAALKALSRRRGTTLFMTMLAGWAVVLSRLSGQADVVVGTPSANRDRPEIENLIGFFVNTLALRVDLSDAPTVAELLGQVRARALEAQQNQDIPFEQVVERVEPARSLSHHPLFQVMFAWQNLSGEGLSLAGVRSGGVAEPAQETAKFDLSLILSESGDRIAGWLNYATSIFERATMERHVGYLRRVLEEMVADDGRRVDRLAILPADERARVVDEWNRTAADFPGDTGVHALFEAQAARTPDAVAVVAPGTELTYAELDRRANRLARHLRARGTGTHTRVAILMPRSVELIVAELAVLKAGAAYVPIDPTFPAERIAFMLADSRARVVVCRAGEPLPGAEGVERIDIDSALADSAEADADDGFPSMEVRGGTAAYVMYTSGSTGAPKGVEVPHRAVARLVLNNGYAAFGPDDRVAFAANPAFDATTMEVWAPLLTGGRVVVIEPEVFLEPAAIAHRLRQEGVTALFVTTAVFNQYAAAIPEALAGLRYLLTGGERADPASFARVLEAGGTGSLIHCYGPTETTTFAITQRVGAVSPQARSVALGRPIANTRVYVLDAWGEPVPVGVAGELHIGGAGVAHGYLDRPELTAERFVADAFGGGAGDRLYRTGDLVCWRADGTLEFLGRNDHQVKIRGFRIELGEIEARLLEHPAVREAVVVAREDAAGGRQLVAYCVAQGGIEIEHLRAHLGERLPEYMVPAAYLLLDAFPLTTSGKVDRRALPAPEGDAYARRGDEAPVGATEEVLAQIWSDVLGVERVGRWDNFFELGGHSLLAVQVGSRVRQMLSAEIALREVFAAPVLADLARAIEAATRATLPAIEPADRAGPLPLSFAQQRLWFLEQLGNLGSTYHIPMTLRLRGTLDRGALVRALDRVVARHEALRTTFPEVDGAPVQRIAPVEASAFRIVEHDFHAAPDAEGELRRLMADEVAAPFDLATGPLVRGRLVRMAADEHVLLITMHHIVSDGWSMGVFVRELSTYYDAFHGGGGDPLPPLPTQYADYAAWQRRWVEGELLERQASYWVDSLAGAPELLELPTDRPRPREQDFAGDAMPLWLDPELTTALKALGRRQGATLFMTILAGWAVVLSRLSGQDDVVVGTPTANRGRGEIEGLIGFFLNTLALRVDLSDAPTVAKLLGQVRTRALEAQQHQDIPFEQIVERVRPVRSLAYSPLFQVLFTWQNAPRERLALTGLQLVPGPEAALGRSKFDLSVALGEREGRIVGGVTYATALFDRETVERYAGYLRRVLEEMVADDARPVDRLALMPEAERAQVVDAWNRTEAEYPAESCIHERFEAQVARTPDARAVVSAMGSLTYGELNAQANRLAHHLRALGVGPGVRVGLCVERSPAMVVGVLAVLKAGGVFVPLDPSYPRERLEYMLADSAPVAVLAQGSAARDLAEVFAGLGDVSVLELDADVPAWSDQPSTNPERGGLTPSHPAYVTYTSGSTGRPKGVPAVHHKVLNLVNWYGQEFGITERDAVLLVMSFSFDGTYRNLFAPLFAGGELHLASEPFDPAGIVGQIAADGISTINLTPTAFQSLVEADRSGALARLRTVILVGEAIQPRRLLELPEPRPALVNLYGPTECSGIVTYHRLSRDLDSYLDRPVPVGRPIPNARIYILDEAGSPVPVGVAGELYIGGTPVGQGYQNRPELTAERFVADPFSAEPGSRLYRTGDRARWLADGTIEVLGRIDFQVKVRGYRIEPGEIESRLMELDAVREAVVVAREDVPGEKRLVAYWVGDGVEAETLRAHVGATLPPYMVPAAYVRLDAFPQTPNGKLDRKALPAPEGDAYASRAYEEPVGETEQALAEIWAEVLRVDRVGRWDNFFDLGGHSLLAVQVISRVRQVLEVKVALAELFTRPVLEDFARELETAGQAALPAIEPVGRDGRMPLSFSQQRLWFLEQLGELGSTYHMHKRLRLRGALDRAALVRALDQIVARHEALRTTFAQVDGAPEQRIAPAEESAFHLVEHDLTGEVDVAGALDRLMVEEAHAPFDLERGPLIRGRLIGLGADDHVLLVTMHHIVSDGWSVGVLTHELGALYGAFHRGEPDPLPPLKVQYADYAVWQRRWVEGDVLREQADYWTRMLAGAPELLDLPTDHPRPVQMDHAGAQLGVVLDEALTAGLKALARRHGTTLFMTLLAGWAVVLGRLAGQGDVVIGTPAAGRGRREIEGLIGFFVNILALRMDLSDAPTVAELLARVKERALEAQHHQDIPFEQVVELVDPVRSLSHHPLFQAMFVWQNAPWGEGLALPGLDVGGVGTASSYIQAKFDLTLALRATGDRIAGEVTYVSSLYERETVERYVGYLRRVLEEMVADDGRRVEHLPLLPADERSRVVEEWNRTDAAYPAESCIHHLFEAHVERAPDATALLFDDEQVSYGELNARANRLAHHLRGLGVGPDVRVAICVERGVEMVVAVLAVLKACGAYVPLDPEYPADRLEYMLADSAPAVVLTQSPVAAALADVFAVLGGDVPVLALDAPTWSSEAATNPAREALTPDHLAYVIYTSGSTGRPKGVLVPHRGVCNVAAAQQREFGVGADDRILQFASLSFDAAAFELVMALASGAALCVSRREDVLPGPDLVALLRRHAVTTVTLPPSALAALPAEELPALRTITVAGEALPAELVARWGTRRRLLNLYGPTEASIWSTMSECSDPARKPDIGLPIANTRAYVLDGAMEPLPVGVAGELYIGGAGVARGYLGRPGLTAERFVPDPFGSDGARLYRTGDRVRRLADGRLDFVGRVDHQVKVRGFRIELGEIEARLLEHPDVREAVVIAREDEPGDRRLVAYVVASEAAGADVLRAHLGETLPEYMVPAAYVRLDALPLTPNGKLDRRALPAPEGDAFAAREYEAPVGRTERALAAIWAEVLRIDRVGRWDNFFELGGHSLLAVQVISRVRQALTAEIALGQLFTRPVLRDLARELEAAARTELPPIEPAPRDGHIPLSFAQQRLWFLEQLGDLGSTYHIHQPLRLRGELDRTALVRALDSIVARHESLRTTFTQVDGAPVQRIGPASVGFALREHDLAGEADAELDRLMAEEARAPFDLERGPLIRGRLVRLGEDDHVLLVTMHHIISDGWSMGVLFGELSALYAARREGREADLAALPVQYADYAAWQRRWVEGDVLQAQADYWVRTLAGAPEVLELPTDRPRPAEMDHAGAQFGVVLDEGLTAGLKALGRQHGTTLFMTILAGWAVVLGRLAGRDDVVIGTPTAGRARREIEGLIGFFVNTLALRVDLSDAPTVADLLARVKTQVLEAQQHEDISFEQVVERVDPVRSLSHSPLFQVMLTWQSAPRGDGLDLPGLAVGGVDAPAQTTAKFDLSLSLREIGDRIVGGVTYATVLFERETVERYVGYLRRVLEEMAADADRRVERLPLLPADERERMLTAWNRTETPYPGESCLHELFERQVARTPDAVALVFEGEHVSYAELNARANRLAHHLRALGVGPDVRVGLCVERGPSMMVGLLGVLKAGGAYVPLDPGYPAERLEYMLADSAPAAVLTQMALRDRIGNVGVPVLELDSVAPAWAERPATDPERGALTPDRLAYVIYTSGSTGRPKGVGVHHRGVVNALKWMEEIAALDGADAVLQKTPYSFDASLRELLPPLLVGARLVLARPEGHKDPDYLLEIIQRERVTVIHGVPSLLQVLVGDGEMAKCTSLRLMMCGGEALPSEIARRFARQVPWARLHNVYGPTEATVDVTAWPCRGEDEAGHVVPIGAPMANVRVYLLDPGGEPVPVGAAGELHVGGVQVARGYLGRPELTAERFVADPFGGEPGARLYRTGDLARWRGDGTIEYLGRMDHQVKVRGFRIELGEIEARLAEHPGVEEAVVLAREAAPGDTRLVAYWTGGEATGADALRVHLADTLPEHMVPAAYVRLEAWPLLPNGKLDRRALPAPADEAYARRGYEAPVGSVEEALSEIWAELLGVERVGRWDHFFELGGHSLLAVRLMERMRRRSLRAEVRALFLTPTLADFAASTDEVQEWRI